MKMVRSLLLAGAVASLAIASASAAGLWPTLPTVGGASRCAGNVTAGVPGTTATCSSTVPAGPTAITGNETIPADTNLQQGLNPASVQIPLRAINAAPISYNLCAAAACGSFTVGTNKGGVLLSYSTTIDSATVVTPASPMDGQRFSIAADHTITSLTVTANTGSTLSVTTPTVLTASTTAPQGYEFMYVASTAKWYRVR
jgi:hypothetical protein